MHTYVYINNNNNNNNNNNINNIYWEFGQNI